MLGHFAEILVGILAVLILVAAAWDVRTRTIPNSLNAAIALLAIPFWWASGLDFWPDAAIQIGIALAVLGLFTIAFAYGAMGGGDVKMVAGLALWLPPGAVVMLLVIMSLAGGVLTAVMLVRHRLTKAQHQLEIPYGVAIAMAGFWLIGERFLNQFA
ncbi:MAG: peptidase [Alphaproteobacteria bacterium]|jgi:prepilin peptidase CpaA|nr:peptidase [Alphaproteobacteria bacterium]